MTVRCRRCAPGSTAGPGLGTSRSVTRSDSPADGRLTFAAKPSYLRVAVPDQRPVREDPAKTPLVRLEYCVVLGGSGYRLTAGREATVDFLADSIAFYINSMVGAGPAAADARITYPEVIGIQIEGPGAVSRGGGFIGGGFGFEGALEGIAIATVLNALTTKTKIHTFIQILSDVGEVFLH